MTPPPDAHQRDIVCAPDSPLRAVLRSLERIARSPVPALIIGESGTGKENVVHRLHQLAPWSAGPLVAINCGAIPANLLESELFGHVRGAFTGADRTRIGRLEAADGGTLFLDEIGELPLELQPKLLRVLQEKVFVPLGGSQAKHANFRVVAATNVDLPTAVETGRFREDLFFRLDVIRVELPALRERPMDIEPLARHFLALHAGPNHSDASGFTADALDELQRYTWPGNVRELENVVQSVLVLREEGLIDRDDVRWKLSQRGAAQPARGTSPGGPVIELPERGLVLKDTLDRLERDLIREALCRANGNRSRAATLLGLNRTTLVEKLRRRPITGDFTEEAFEAASLRGDA